MGTLQRRPPSRSFLLSSPCRAALRFLTPWVPNPSVLLLLYLCDTKVSHKRWRDFWLLIPFPPCPDDSKLFSRSVAETFFQNFFFLRFVFCRFTLRPIFSSLQDQGCLFVADSSPPIHTHTHTHTHAHPYKPAPRHTHISLGPLRSPSVSLLSSGHCT